MILLGAVGQLRAGQQLAVRLLQLVEAGLPVFQAFIRCLLCRALISIEAGARLESVQQVVAIRQSRGRA